MKKLITTTIIVLAAFTVKAEEVKTVAVTSGKKTITLTRADKAYLMACDARIREAITTLPVIRNNQTADLILTFLKSK